MTPREQSLAATVTTGPAAAAEPDPAPARRPWWIWVVPFTALFAVLLIRNRFLFSTRIYEGGDTGANSILIEQALHLRLLVGNYSREGFNHPGPAYLYVQALGQWVARDLLRIVPTDWNGQLLASFALDSAFLAICVGIVYGWTRSLRGAAACFLVILALVAAHPQVASSDWMPYLYVPTFLAFLLAAASATAGRAGDLWALALSGWFLMHGHVCFLFFVPVLLIPPVAAAWWRCRGSPGRCVRAFLRDHRSAWISVLVISAVFLVPIVVNLALHWPGDFGKYLAYGRSGHSGGHSAGAVLRYLLWFWWPYRLAGLVAVALFAVAVVVTARLVTGSLRQFLAAILVMNAAATLAFAVYAAAGIDELSATGHYIGYFYWSVPFLTAAVIVVGLVQAARPAILTPLVAAGSAAGLAAALAAVAFVPGLTTSLADNEPTVPAAVATLAARAAGRPVVIHIADHYAWPATTAFLVQAERTHVRACVDQPSWTFMMTSQFICTAGEMAAGAHYEFLSQAPPPGTPVIARFGPATVIPAIGRIR